MADKWATLWLMGSDMRLSLAPRSSKPWTFMNHEPHDPKGKLVEKTHKREEKQEQKQECQELAETRGIF